MVYVISNILLTQTKRKKVRSLPNMFNTETYLFLIGNKCWSLNSKGISAPDIYESLPEYSALSILIYKFFMELISWRFSTYFIPYLNVSLNLIKFSREIGQWQKSYET